jgi:serine/threonine protein kinase
LPERAFQIPDRDDIPDGEIYYVTRGDFVGFGATSIVDKLSSGNIVKYPKPNPYCPHDESKCREEMKTEAEAYRRIGNNARIPTLIRWEADSYCLALEYLQNGDLISYFRRHANDITTKQKEAWAVQAAEALAVVHAADVIHCDVTPRNFMLDGALELRIADCAGCSIAGSSPTITTSPRFQPPGWNWKRTPVLPDDIFALGSVLYLIMTGDEPHANVTEDEVERRFNAADFPDVSMLSCGHVIRDCWMGDCNSAHDVASALRSL